LRSVGGPFRLKAPPPLRRNESPPRATRNICRSTPRADRFPLRIFTILPNRIPGGVDAPETPATSAVIAYNELKNCARRRDDRQRRARVRMARGDHDQARIRHVEPTSKRIDDSAKMTQEAIGHLARIAASSAAQSEHEARMVAATASSGDAARKLLEQQADRARRMAWVVAASAAAMTLTAAIVTVRVAWRANDTESAYKMRLLEQHAERRSLEGQRDAQRAVADTMRSQLERDDRLVDRLLSAMERLQPATAAPPGAPATTTKDDADRTVPRPPSPSPRPLDNAVERPSSIAVVRLVASRPIRSGFGAPLWVYPNDSGRCTPPAAPRRRTISRR